MRFFRSDSGYALVLTLLFMPVFVGMSLLVIDISRGNNAQSDLQAAADALALAGARELDGGVNSIDRAILAMTEVSNTVSFLGRTDEAAATSLAFSDSDRGAFTVVFLSDLPASDDTPLTQAFLTANSVTNDPADLQGDARFVYVRAQSRDLSPFFALFFDGVNQVTDVPVAAQAVATYRTAACNVTPLFICNPFERPVGQTQLNLQEAFAEGRLHGRLIRLLPRGNNTAYPGNFGLLSTADGNGVNELREAFASGGSRTCYEAGTVTTQPGRPAAIRTGINVRFDMYAGNMNRNEVINGVEYAPAANVRRGFIVDTNSANPNWCNAEPTPNSTWTTRFPDNDVMPEIASSGAAIGEGSWSLQRYFDANHPQYTGNLATLSTEINSFPGAVAPGSPGPSRYDVYRWEIEDESGSYPNNASGDRSRGDGVGLTLTDVLEDSRPGTRESGLPQCTRLDASELSTSRDSDRRVIFSAIVDCLAQEASGRTELTVNSFASIFLVSPMLQRTARPGDDPAETIDVVEDAGVIDVEIVDITGSGGGGTLDTFVRDEAILVR